MFQEPGFKMGLMPAEMRVSAFFLFLDVRGIPPKTPVSPFLLSRKKRSKRKHDPPDLPFKGGSICYGQRPAYAKILVWLSSFRPFGIRHGVFNGLRTLHYSHPFSSDSKGMVSSLCPTGEPYISYNLYHWKHSGFKGQRAPFSGGWESEAERQGRRSVMQSQDEGLGYPTERGKINTPAG